jgi:YbbR domain-containing protein
MSKERILRDTTIKILSVIFATLLWFYVITEQNPVVPKDITIPVRIVNLEALNRNNLIMLGNTNSYYITLKLKGKKEVLDTVNQNTIDAYADISNYLVKGESAIPVIVNGIPEGISVISRSQHNIKVSLDKKIVVQKPVTVNITGNPKGGLANLDAVLTPSEVVLTGAESIINTVETIKVDVDIAGVDLSVNKKLPVRLLDEEGKDVAGIQLDTQWINVNVPIANTKRVPIQLILEGEPAEGLVIASKKIQPTEILVTGNQEALDSLFSVNTKKQIINNMAEDITLAVMLDLPEGIQLVNTNEQINAVIDIQKVITSTVDISTMEFRNLGEKYFVNDAPLRNIRLNVRGPEELLEDIENNITLYVDLTNAKEGSASYEIQVIKSPLVEILELEPKSIGLDIRIRE